MEKQYTYTVATICWTYNHAKYIEDTLTGFVIQQTTFPVVYIIIDDASTDGEQGVLKEWASVNLNLHESGVARHEDVYYGKLIFARHKNSINAYFAILLLAENHYQKGKHHKKDEYIVEWLDNAKYVALCEGDDYWTDSHKLEKQVSFLDEHLEHSLCFCSHQNLYPSGEIIDEKRYNKNMEVCPMSDLILGGGGYMATNSMCYRNSMYTLHTLWAKECPVDDLPMMLTLANNGKVGYLSDVMCVYRRSAIGSWSNKMSADIRKRYIHLRAIYRMWHQFDKYSNHKYHSLILKRNLYTFKSLLVDTIKTIFHK